MVQKPLLSRLKESFQQSISYLSEVDQGKALHALHKAEEWHDGQKRDSGDPYVTHTIGVALYLAELEADSSTLQAALLHDVIEDDRIDIQTLKKEFGSEVTRLVDSVTKLTKLRYEGKRQERQIASLRKMLLVASEDLRVICIKLADRRHNIETIHTLREDKRQRVALETLDIYVPFARIVGLWEFKEIFENICFPIAYPEESATWHQAIAHIRSRLQQERDSFVKRINAETDSKVVAELSLSTDYELYQKLRANLSRLGETQNIDSVAVVIKGKEMSSLDCYKVLGQIHMHYPVHTLYFRDYISAPQPNGYRALHTVIFLSKEHELRLKVQTAAMRDYAQHRKMSGWLMDKKNDVFSALGSLHVGDFDKDQYLQDLKTNVLNERINVFTAWGEVITLPQGATGIDFAFAIRPDEVFLLSGIRVNGDVKQATHTLTDGDTVDLILSDKGKAEARALWVDKAKSVAARESLKINLSSQSKVDQENEGKSLLEHELRKRKLPEWALFRRSPIQHQLINELQIPSLNELFQRIGSGFLSVRGVVDTYENLLSGSQH
jgi:GTP pyrophosphokinase